MTARAIGAAVLLAGLAIGLTAVPAVAQEPPVTPGVTGVAVVDGRVRFLVTGLEQVEGATGTGPVSVRVAGFPVDARATVPQAPPRPAPRSTVLAIDTSGSMAGPLLATAKSAAASFLDAAPPTDRIGLIGFADRPVLLAPPTAARADVRDAVAGLDATGSTALFDAVDLALSTLGTEQNAQVLVLSDGADTVSALDLPGLLARVRAAPVRVDLVQVGPVTPGGADPQQTAIAGAGRGQVFDARGAVDAAGVFRERAVRSSATVTVDAALPPGLTSPTARLQVAFRWGGQDVRIDTTIELSPGGTAGGAVGAAAAPAWPWLFGGLAGIFAALVTVVLAVVAVPRSARDRRRAQKLVAHYQPGGRATAAPAGGLRTGALGVAERVAAHRGIGERLAVRLERAAVAWRPNEWLLLCAGTGVLAAMVLGVLLGSAVIGVPLGVLLGMAGPHLFLTVRARRRVAAFGNDLPDALQLVASGLSSGYSLPQALDSVVRLGEGPVAEEVGRALAGSRLGTPVEDALDEIADRTGSVDFRWVVMAIRVQRDVGGNLADVLLQVAATIRERGWLRRHVQALAAEGKLSGAILAALPVVVAGYMFVVRPDYVGILLTEPVGLMMLAGGVVMLGIGMLWMNKIAKVEL